jgi:hypothetical protein
MEFQAHDADIKLLAQRKNKEVLVRNLEERRVECSHLEENINALKVGV